MTYSEQLQSIVEDYRQSGQIWPASARDIAAWAVCTRRWQPQSDTIISQCAEQLSRAMREEYISDSQGRRVRAKHAATFREDGEQQTLWDDIRTASHEHMEIAFQQRRKAIVGDCRQLKADVDSYNENNANGAQFQLTLDFTRDVEELELASAMADFFVSGGKH